jgi:hypothetical protein
MQTNTKNSARNIKTNIRKQGKVAYTLIKKTGGPKNYYID